MKNSIDINKFIACVLIVGSHCLPIFVDDTLNYYYGQWLFRFCVPFYFISSGYFFAKMEDVRKKSYIKRIMVIYLASTIIYTPLFFSGSILSIGRNILFGYHHLWYLSALAIGLLFICISDKLLHNRKYYLILMLVGGGTTRRVLQGF